MLNLIRIAQKQIHNQIIFIFIYLETAYDINLYVSDNLNDILNYFKVMKFFNTYKI